MIDMGGINIFVGMNNSGKSTAIKALILYLKNIQSFSHLEPPIINFSFANNLSSHTHLGDFRNNLPFNGAANTMEFGAQLGETIVRFELKGSALEYQSASLSVPIKRLTCSVPKYGLALIYERTKSGIRTTFSFKLIGIHLLRDDIRTKLAHEINPKYNIDNLSDIKVIDSFLSTFGKYTLKEEINISWDDYYVEDDKRIYEGLSLPLDADTERGLYYIVERVRHIIDQSVDHYHIEYVEAHSASHNEILFEEDKNNYLAQTVARFESEKIYRGSRPYLFVKKWLRELKIGQDFIISRPYSEVFKVDIKTDTGNKPLATMGTGSIQLFILLLQIAIAMLKGKVILVIEEPEQNLHPAIQSKLADLFLDAVTESAGRIQFVIETHSEYLVRRTQVFIAEATRNNERSIEELNKQIKVFYFPENDIPYSLEYRSTGQFERQFGPGFFDEAGKNYRALLELNR